MYIHQNTKYEYIGNFYAYIKTHQRERIDSSLYNFYEQKYPLWNCGNYKQNTFDEIKSQSIKNNNHKNMKREMNENDQKC